MSKLSRKDRKRREGVVFSTNPDFKYRYQAEEDAVLLPPEQQNLRLYIDRKQRKGKAVTVVEGFQGPAAELKVLERILKLSCGCGGSSKDGLILIQGEWLQQLQQILKDRGYKV